MADRTCGLKPGTFFRYKNEHFLLMLSAIQNTYVIRTVTETQNYVNPTDY